MPIQLKRIEGTYEPDYILNILEKFKNHPSVIKIKGTVNNERFLFANVDESFIYDKIGLLEIQPLIIFRTEC